MPTFICPTCHKSVPYAQLEEVRYRPFCSERCKLVDLGRWLNEDYRISEQIPDRADTDDPDLLDN